MKGERRSTTKITLRLRPVVVAELYELAERWDVTLSDVVAAGIETMKTDTLDTPHGNECVALLMKQIRLDTTGHRAFPRKTKKRKAR